MFMTFDWLKRERHIAPYQRPNTVMFVKSNVGTSFYELANGTGRCKLLPY